LKYHSANREAERLREELKESKKQVMQDKIDHYKEAYEGEQKKLEELQNQLTTWLQIGDDDVTKLKQYITEVEKKLATERSKADGAEKHRRESINYLSNQMMSSLTDAEDMHGKELKTLKQTIARLEEEKKALNMQLHAEERKRKHSNAEVSASMFNKLLMIEQEKDVEKKKYEVQVKELQKQLDEMIVTQPRRASEVHHSMFNSLLDAEGDFNNAKKEWERKERELRNEIRMLQEELAKMKEKVDKTDRIRRESITQLQDDMWKHLVEADEENKKERKKLQGDAKNFKDEVVMLRKRVSYLENSKLAMIEECNRQLNILRTGVIMMHK